MGLDYTVTVVALSLSAQGPEHRTSAYLQKIPTIAKPACFLLVSLLNDLISFWVFVQSRAKSCDLRVLASCATGYM